MYLSCQWISKYTKLWIQYDGEKVFRAKTLAKMVIPDRNNLYMVIYIRLALYPWVLPPLSAFGSSAELSYFSYYSVSDQLSCSLI